MVPGTSSVDSFHQEKGRAMLCNRSSSNVRKSKQRKQVLWTWTMSLVYICDMTCQKLINYYHVRNWSTVFTRFCLTPDHIHWAMLVIIRCNAIKRQQNLIHTCCIINAISQIPFQLDIVEWMKAMIFSTVIIW